MKLPACVCVNKDFHSLISSFIGTEMMPLSIEANGDGERRQNMNKVEMLFSSLSIIVFFPSQQ